MPPRRRRPFVALLLLLILMQSVGSSQAALAIDSNAAPLDTILYQTSGGTPRATIGLRSPVPPTSSNIYIWDIKPAFPFSRIDLVGCWNRQQVKAILIDKTNAYNASINADGSIRLVPRTVGNSVQRSVPVAIQVGFTQKFPSAEGVTRLTSTNYRGLPRAVKTEQIGGPVCLTPPASLQAPPLDRSRPTAMVDATAFLYSGSNPVQQGVASNTIQPTQVAVLRGAISTRDGQPLSNVTVQVLNHREFGVTLSRADGRFDMAVNGGGALVVQYQREGYLPVQRQVQVPWQEYALLPDVVMIPLDPQVTTVTTGSKTTQVARGSVMSDADGIRQATLIVPDGLTAAMKLPDGTTKQLSNLHVRATEYTVGSSGPASMPGNLPPNSGYTYATAFSVDEAIAAGAEHVTFNKPVISYLENFLKFPVGSIVPVGSYEPTQAAWQASNNGLVIKILSIAAQTGLVELDLDGSGTPADATKLAQLGISTGERQKLAALYQAGQTLWRVPTMHFSNVDYNWPYGCPTESNGELACKAPNGGSPRKPTGPNGCSAQASIIGCQRQTLGEAVDVVGTSSYLRYASDRTPGYRSAYSLEIPLVGNPPPAKIKYIELRIQVAGKWAFSQLFNSGTSSYTFTWDGIDVYGRVVQGEAPITVRIGYIYDAVYVSPKDQARAFASFGAGNTTISGIPTRKEIEVASEWHGQIGGWDARTLGLGGWDLNVHHTYDPQSQTLYLGDGTQRSAESMSGVLSTFAGTGVAGLSDDGLPATASQINLYGEDGLAIGPDGSIYIAERNNHRVSKVDPNGLMTTFAGGGGGMVNGNSCGSSGDGGPAKKAFLCSPSGVAIGPDGSMYIADTNNHRVRRVGPDGIITTVAGVQGQPGFNGDNQPAIQARLNQPKGVAIGPDNSLYIADNQNYRVRRVGPDGFITTVAGNGGHYSTGDNGQAADASLDTPIKVAIGQDGSIYIAEQGYGAGDCGRVRRVGPNGIITRLAGVAGGCPIDYGDGGSATAARLDRPYDVALGPDGSVYIADTTQHRVRRVGTDGIITTVAGGANIPPYAQGLRGPATRAVIGVIGALAVDNKGKLYLADATAQLIHLVSSPLPAFSGGSIVLASTDGSEVYEFDSRGRHLTTREALTGALRYSFGYDSNGRLYTITDGDANVTTMIYNPDGRHVSIVAPGGQRTELATDTNGYLSSIANPAKETVQLTTDNLGLLGSFTDPRGNLHQFKYDSDGRLYHDSYPGGDITLGRIEGTYGYTVTLTTALGRATSFGYNRFNSGEVRQVVTEPSGARTMVSTFPDGSQKGQFPDGTHVEIVNGPDPRWGMQVPVLNSMTTTLPDGTKQVIGGQRTVELVHPYDLLSIRTLIDTLTINGDMYLAKYDGTTRTFTMTTPLGRQSSFTLDEKGRLARTLMDPKLDPMTRKYDEKGRLFNIQQGNRSFTYTYDSGNRLKTRTDSGNQQIVYNTYDAADRLKQMTLASGLVYQYGYDTSGNFTALTMPGGSTYQMSYTAIDHPADFTPPSNAAYGHTYDTDRALQTHTLPSGRATTSSYEPNGRISGQSYPESATTFGYDDSSDRVSHITSTPTNNGSAQQIDMTYNGSLVNHIAFSGAVVQNAYDYSYTNRLALQNITMTSGTDKATITLNHDKDGLATSYGSFIVTRDGPAGAMSRMDDGKGALALGYDRSARTTNRQFTIVGKSIYASQLRYNNLGLIDQNIETIGGTAHTLTYSYDKDNQLKQVKRNGVVIEEYSYDANGNRKTVTSAGSSQGASYDSQDRLLTLGAVSYQIDTDGFMTQRGSDTFQYSTHGELLRAVVGGKTVTYGYDGMNRRVTRTDSAGTTVYLYGDPANPLLITAVRGPDAKLTLLTYDEAGLLIALEQGGVRSYIATDQVGTPRVVVSSNSSVVKTLTYDSFGRLITDSNPALALPIGYAGGLADPLTGLVHFGWRDYDPASGRWTARDPLLIDGGQANLYAYVGNNPISHRDPLGLFCFGGSAYEVIGGGAQVCINEDGFSLCGELGAGFGASVEADGNAGLPTEGFHATAEAEAYAFGFGVNGGVDLDPCPAGNDYNYQFTPKLEAGFNAFGFGWNGGDKAKVDPGLPYKKGLGRGVEGKIAEKFCGVMRWSYF